MRCRPHFRFLLVTALLSLAFLAFATARVLAAPDAAEHSITSAWRTIQSRGGYHFSADVRQTTSPTASVTNVGRQSRTDTVHLEGDADFEEREMRFTLWSQGGNVLDPDSGAQVRIDEDGAYARQGDASWQPVPDFSAAFAPDGDFLAYLHGARGIQEAESGSQGGIAYTRYTFELNGPALARRMRDQLQQQMTARGELPAGLSLALPELYAGMTGSGELWLDADGLPLRQRLSLQFPEQDDQQVSADIDVSFSGAGAASETGGAVSAPIDRLRRFLYGGDIVRTMADGAAFALLLATVFILLMGRHRSHRLRHAIIVTGLVALVFTPLLQAAQAARAESGLKERRALRETAAEEDDMQRQWRTFLTDPDAQYAPATSGDLYALQAPAAQDDDPLNDLLLEGAATQTDSDRDGLTDYQERLLGTNRFQADSDGDMLPDSLEVEGFEYGGRHWTSNPLELDSNRDGLSDTREWLADADDDGVPGDTDGDGVPDLLDRDNDGDGVPDRLDISPFAVSASLAQDDPLGLTFSNLAQGRPTLVDFQLRPSDPDHLWYAFNVLDWPQGDGEGQMQDVDGKTFADVSGRELVGQEADGDLRLVPMLEIEIEGPLTHLPAAGELRQMGMVVQTPRDEQGRVRNDRPAHVYLPLRLVTDPNSRAQVAFEGTMLYRPEFDLWGAAHRVRLAWLVQALVDVCVDAGAGETGCDATQNNQPQVLHVYYESWQLTGLDVREDHGIELAILYEDPAMDPAPHDDDALMMLAGGLAQTFLAGRDTNEDGQPDLTPDEIARRFALGSDDDDSRRWAIPNIVDVTRRSYEHRAQALATIVMTDTASILNGRFSPHVESGSAISPTLMFAREERFRAVNLDSQDGTDLVTWRGSNLTVDLNADDVPLQTVAGLSWAPFRYNDDVRRWESFAIDDYWDLLASRYPFVEETDPQIAAGKQFALQLLYLTLYAGVSETIQFDGAIPPNLRSETDQALAASMLSHFLKGASYFINGYVAFLLDVGTTTEGFTWRDWAKVKELVTSADRELGLLYRDLKARFQSLSTFGKGAVIAALILLLAGLILLAVFAFVTESLAARITVATIVGGLLLWLDVVSPIYSVIQGIRGLVTAETGFFSAARAWLATSSGQSAVNAAKFAAVLALVITLVVVWVDFFITINRHDFQAGSIPFNLLLSQAIAGTAVAVLALALVFALPIVGTVIVGIIGVWDLIMTILGLNDLVLTSRATQFLADIFYGVNSTVDEPDVTPQERELSLVDPSRGLVAGNALSVSATVLTEIEHNRPRHNVLAYRGSFYTGDYLDTTALDYQLNTRPESEGQTWSRPGPWRPRHGEWYLGGWLWRGERESTVPSVSLPLAGAGINQVAAYDFRVRYDLPGWECWGISLLAYCDGRRINGENGTVDTTIVLDVFPPTVEAFYALDWGAWQPAWSCPPDASSGEHAIWVALDRRCQHGLPFPVQRDHDGDGLLAQAVGGLDPDDTRWDSDGDGLSDRYELELAQEGQALALHLAADSDGDGLCDDQELRFGADPGLSDSDGDGLLDGEEILHQDRCDGDADGDTIEWLGGWTFTYAVADDGQRATVPVSSSPRLADSDGDGLNDLAEKQLHERNPLLYPYHPQVANETSLALYSSLSDGDGVLAPGQTVVYSATVRNSLFAPLYSAGALTVTLPSALGGERVTTPFNLYRQQEETVTRAVRVAPGSASGEAQVAQFAGAQLHSGDGNPLFSWLPPRVTSATLGGDRPLTNAAAAVPGPSWPSSQLLLAMLRGQDEAGPCGEDVACSAASVELVSIAPAGHVSETITIDAFQDFDYPLAGKQPDLAFSGDGNGLLVYARPTCEGQDCRPSLTVMGLLLAPGLTAEPVPFPISVPGGNVATARIEDVQVAADGAGFLVLWQMSDVASGERTLHAARVSTDGEVSPLLAPALEAAQRLLDLVWSGERYVLAWTALVGGDSHVLRLTALDGRAQVQAGAQFLLSPSQPVAAQARIAAAPFGNRVLVIYGGAGTPIRARLLGGDDLSAPVTLWDGETAFAPQIAYDASTRGWLASWLATGESGDTVLHYQALDLEGQPRLARQDKPLEASAADLALGCGEQGAGCLAMVYEATTVDTISLFLDPLATVIDRPLPLLIDADPPTSTITSLQNGQVISATGALVIGGLAADPTSRAAAVEVSINNRPCQDVVGAAVWAATCPIPDLDGPAIITSRAQDLVGNRERQVSQLTIILDRQPPQVSLSQTAPGHAVAAQTAGEGIWLLPLSGEARDPTAGPVPGSGVARVEARLAWDRTWQPAEIDGASWGLNYRLPLFDPAFELLSEPTGSYTFTLRAFDHTGNVSLLPQQVVRVDNRPPSATLTVPAAEDRVISHTLTLGGLLTETGSVQSGLSGLALALTEANAVVSPTTWLPAELARSGPGVISTTWSAALPSGLEGVYQIDVRGTDVLNNRNDDRSTWTQWQGEIDSLAPRTAVTVTYSGAGDSAQTLYRLWAEDFNLASTTFPSVCPQAPVQAQTYSEPWWDEVIGDRTRIYSQTAACRVTGFRPGAVTVEACDRFGRCTLDSQAPSATLQTPALHSAVLTPTHQTVLTDDAPLALIVGAHADDGLAAASVLLDGATLASRSWEDGPADARWATTWQPPGEGIFSLTSIVTDTVGRVQTDTVSTRISVDLTPPQVSLATTIITATHRLAPGRVDLTGAARDAVGVAAVAVQIDGGPWLPAVIQGEEWIFPWQIGADLDGQGFAVAVRATDHAGHVDELRRRVVVDVRPPDPVTIELAYVENGGVQPLQPGETIRASSAILDISWTGGNAGITTNTYLAGWSVKPTPDVAELTAYTGSDRHEQTIGEPQAVYAHLLIRDAYGNTTAQRLGPVIVDGPGTPDYVADLAYDGWQHEETTLVGVDWALAHRATTGAALSAPQRLYASWDASGLRLTWTGAQWNRDGDLFVYLDTGGTENDGATQLYNPYRGPNPTISLPQGFTADTLVQVEDSRGATLLRWDGDAWVTSSTLSGDRFIHDAGAQPARTDLYLPFELLGIEDPEESGLALLALASEEETLRLWATIPDKNPLNSERAVAASAAPFLAADFRLTQALSWAALGNGQTPNAGLQPGADLQLTIASNPPGASLVYLGSGLPQVQPGTRLDENLNGHLDPSLPLDTEPRALPDGTVVTYTIGYANRGEATAEAVSIDVAAYGALTLPETALQTIDLGNVAPGISGTVVFTASVNVSRTQNIASAELDVAVSDLAHGIFDWLWVQHDVDASPPAATITVPERVVPFGPIQFQGTVDGPADVADVTVVIRTWLSGDRALTFCSALVIDGDSWTCTWDPGEETLQDLEEGMGNEPELIVQARATDIFDRRGDWSAPLALVVDRAPPQLALSSETIAFLSDGYLNATELDLTGVISDTDQAGPLEVCLQDTPCQRLATTDGAWHVAVTAAADADGLPQRMTLQGFDVAGNHSERIVLDFQLDVRAPDLAITNQLTTSAPSAVMTSVLSGTVREAAGPPTVTVRIVPPSGPARLEPVAVSDASWHVALAPSFAGRYQLIVEARDRAGNIQMLPARTLVVSATGMPPAPGPPLPGTSTQVAAEFVRYLTSGAFIRLVVEPALPGLWSQVQWRDTSGRWHNVDGWQGGYTRNNEVLWWVSQNYLGTGPYRWLIADGPGGPVLAYSDPFLVPDQSGKQTTVTLTLLNTPARPR